MLTKLTMELEEDTIDYKKASALQGVMFEHIDSDYGEMLHQSVAHPYSQYLSKKGGKTEWVINTFNDEAYEKIISPLLEPSFDDFYVKKGNAEVKIKKKSLTRTDMKELLDEFYNDKAERYFDIEALTPVAFKQNGSYNIMPETRLIFQSLMNKYSAVDDNISMADPDTLDEFSTSAIVSWLRITTLKFPLEGVTVPRFVGNFTLHIKGTETMTRYARLLLKFGEYSGLGVKTSMGMGAIRLTKRGKENGAE